MALPTILAEAAWPTDPLAAVPTWVTVPKCRTLKITGNHRSAALGRFEAGVINATFTNKDRSLEPLFAAGANYPNVRTRKRVRFRAVANGGAGSTYPIAHGYVEKVAPTYPKDWKDAVCTLTASDAFRLFAGIQLVHPYQAEVLKDVPTAYYRFLETAGPTAVDSSGNANTGTYSSTGITWSQVGPITDSSNHAIQFNGTTGYAVSPPVIYGASGWSIEAWFKVSSVPGFPALIVGSDKLTGAQPPYWYLAFSSVGAGEIYLQVGRTNGAAGSFVSTSGTTYADGAWHQVVFTWASSNLESLYVDGALVSSSSGLAYQSFPTRPITIGPWDEALGGSAVPVSVAEVAFYANTVLSATRVAAHYAARTAWLGDQSDARVTRVLDSISWPAADRDLDAGVAVLTDAGDLASQKALDHLRLVDATEGGCLVMSRDGKVMFRNRRSIQTGPARNTVSQATFGDQGGTEIGYTELGLTFDDIELANRITITRRNGITAVALDQAQITASGTPQDRAQSSISNSDIDAMGQGQGLLALLKNPNRWRFEKVVVSLTDTNQDAVLGREIWDRVTVAFTPPGGGGRISQDVLIVGIDHNALPGHWDVTFHTTGTDLQIKPFIIGTSFVGGTDLVAF